MKTSIPALCILLLLTLILPARSSPPQTQPAPHLRLGTYHSRVVALAYWRSTDGMKRIQSVVKEAQDAQKSGDKEKAADLAKKAQSLQRQLHNEVFGNVPIPEVIDALKPTLAEVAKDATVSAIVPDVAWSDPTVQLIDLTDRIVEKCHPTEETQRLAQQLDQHPPAEMQVIGED
ncbi:MAG: hypothetical protein ACTHN5_07390 [Phycisphaerae bacterium]